jgi:hypothetical protein
LKKRFKRIIGKLNAKEQSSGQIELDIERRMEPDRNLNEGGRSFYFFDFDDNVLFLSTPIFIFHKKTKKEKKISSSEFALVRQEIGVSGVYKDYELNFCPADGSYRNFRDKEYTKIERKLHSVIGKKEGFVEDIKAALVKAEVFWKGPSWGCFYHAVFNERPISVITARGHHPETVKEGISLLVKHGHLPKEPNYLEIYPVNYINTCQQLGHTLNDDVADVKKSAIKAAVKKATEVYGLNYPHRFGMSDDDPKNLRLIMEAMGELKNQYPHMSFFVISTYNGGFLKQEVFPTKKSGFENFDKQLDLF